VASYAGAPDVGVDNLGSVSASCDDVASGTDEAACFRQLKDEACRLGADVIWGVPDHPVETNGKHVLKARAAHTKAGKAGPSAH
jgi:hypothetical protein